MTPMSADITTLSLSRSKEPASSPKAKAKAKARGKAKAKGKAKGKGPGKALGKAAAVDDSANADDELQIALLASAGGTDTAAIDPYFFDRTPVAELAFGVVSCSFCNHETEFSKCRLVGKQQMIWKCGTCNSKSTQLRRLFGTWPTEEFSMLPQAVVCGFTVGFRALSQLYPH